VSLHLHISSPDFKAQETGQPIEEEQSQDVFSSTEPSGPSTSKTSKVSESCDIPVGKCAPIILKNKAPRWHEQLQCWCLNFHGHVTVASVKNFQLVAAIDPSRPEAQVDQGAVLLQFDITTTNEHLNLDSSDAGLETENGGCLHYLYNHTTDGSQLTGALLLMILLYNLYDIENRVFTCRNKYSINKVNETGPVESLLKLLGSENDISVRAEADGALRALSSRLDSAKRSLVDADGFPVFISTILVPSKEFSCGVVAKKFKCRTEQRDILFAYNRDSSSFRFLGKFMFLVV
jgi:hypothetical protein